MFKLQSACLPATHMNGMCVCTRNEKEKHITKLINKINQEEEYEKENNKNKHEKEVKLIYYKLSRYDFTACSSFFFLSLLNEIC